MGDETIGELYKAMKEDRQERHFNNNKKNISILEESGVKYRMASRECLCFRGKCKVDFYPSTGRWRDLSNGRTFSGGAKNFLKWLKKQTGVKL